MALPVIAAAAARLLLGAATRVVARATAKGTLEKAAEVEKLKARVAESLIRSGGLPDVSMKLLGAPEVAAMLREMKEITRKKIIRGAVRQGANIMLRRIKDTTYDDNTRKRRTGNLKRGIRVTTSIKSTENVYAFIATNRKDKNAPYYWWFLERGTSERRTKNGSRGSIYARPYVAPAFAATSAASITKISNVLKTGVEREQRKLRGV